MKEGYHIRKYKRYIDDHSVSVPKSTKLDCNKRSATRSKTAISIPQSVEESASHKRETFVQETETTIWDYRGVLKLWSTNSYALTEV